MSSAIRILGGLRFIQAGLRLSVMGMCAFPAALLCCVAVLAPGCAEDGGWECDSACYLFAGPVEVPADMEIRYEARGVGDGVFTEVRYLDNSEPEQAWIVVEEAPIMTPWFLDSGRYRRGMRVGIEAEGVLQNGTLGVRFFQRRDPESFSGLDQCKRMCSM